MKTPQLSLTFTLLLGVLASSCVVSATGATDTTRTLRERASFDLNCNVDEIEVVEIDQVTRGVRGCGNRATYVWSGASQTWVMNAKSQRDS